MDTSLVEPLLVLFQSYPSELLSVILLLFCCGAIILLLRFYGVYGLYVYNAVAIIAANIQVLKLSYFPFWGEPLALGTIVFATTYLVSDILTELYGKKVAKDGVWLCFGAQVLFTVMMLLTLAHAPAAEDTTHGAMAILFTPSLRLFISSLAAFAISQMFDIWVFQKIRQLTNSRRLWLRTIFSFLLAGFIDNVVFSFLAWYLLSPEPLGIGDIWNRYVFGTYTARILVAAISLPTIYYCRHIKRPTNA
ncbi:MAG: queuosine precursor transporter [Alphaproteobacteria bacterium]